MPRSGRITPAASQLRVRLPIGSPVSLDVKVSDRYGRIVAEVISQINIGLSMVEGDGEACESLRR